MINALLLRCLFITLFTIGFTQNSFALQIKSVTENSEVSAIVASQDLTRIALDHDRIVRVRGLAGAYELKHDTEQGALFIRPTEEYQTKPFTLFIATEHHHNYVLHLTPKEQWGDTILLKHKVVKKLNTLKSKNHSSYIKTLTSFMTHMMAEDIPSPYVVKDFIHAKPYAVNQTVTVKPIRQYVSNAFQGTVYQVTNHSQKIILLNEGNFYQKGDRAIALSQLMMAPLSQVTLYKVRHYE